MSKMPSLFVGHGNPMNALGDNIFSEKWHELGLNLPRPKTILCISAHWITDGIYVTAMEHPRTIHDFGGFPKELFDMQYPAAGNPELAKFIVESIPDYKIHLDYDWGLDHGTWSVINSMYPDADIPVIQLSINYDNDAQWHYEFAKKLKFLREQGVLIIGSGNIIHNLRLMFMNMNGRFPNELDENWADSLNDILKEKIQSDSVQDLINYHSLDKYIELAVPSFDHYFPLLYILGLRDKDDKITFFNDVVQERALSMTSFLLS